MKKFLKITLVSALVLFTLADCNLASSVSAESPAFSADSGTNASAASVTERDASGTYDAAQAVPLSPQDDLTITEAGVYLLSGSYEDSMIVIDAGDEAKVQLVLANASISGRNGPAIYVRSADKVFLTADEGTVNTVSDSASYTFDEEDTTPDAAVFSKADLTINGSGRLTVSGNYKHAVVSKDNLVITAKDLTVNAENVGLNGKDSVILSEATVSITAGSDGIRSENGTEAEKGLVSVTGSEITIVSGKDGIQANGKAEIASGTLNITAREGIEATYVLLSGGNITIQASDDGINAAYKSSAYTPTIEITGGTVTVTMSAGDTDGIDSNGNIIISGGTVSVNGSSPFDYDGSAALSGGIVYVNGQQVSSLPNQMMGGMNGFGGGPDGQGGFGGRPGGQGGFEGGRGGMGGFEGGAPGSGHL